MCSKSVLLAMLAVGLSVSADALELNITPLAADASTPSSASQQLNTPGRNKAALRSNAAQSSAGIDQPGAVVMPPPILRYAGNTAVTPDRPLLGRLRLQAQTLKVPLLAEPPALQVPPNVAAISSGARNAGEAQTHD